ncbi:MAG: helix-turn-helix domain-containing protein, partial [Catenulispora sp.]
DRSPEVVMAPLADAAVQRELAILTNPLTRARSDRGDFPQHRLAAMLGVSTSSVIGWESGQESLTVHHLILWARALTLKVVIVNAAGTRIRCPLSREPGEAWADYELRGLTVVLHAVRNAYPKLSQFEVADRAGVSRRSIRRWENLESPPRTLGFIRWTMALECRARLAPLRPPSGIPSTAES